MLLLVRWNRGVGAVSLALRSDYGGFNPVRLLVRIGYGRAG